MTIVSRWLQAIGIILVGIGLVHGFMDPNMWEELWYTLAGVGIFYASTLILRRRQ